MTHSSRQNQSLSIPSATSRDGSILNNTGSLLQTFQSHSSPALLQGSSNQAFVNAPLNKSIIASEYEWRTKNSEHLETLEERSKSKRRRSSVLLFSQTLKAFDEVEYNNVDDDDDDKSYDSFVQKIEEAIDPIKEEEEAIDDALLSQLSFNMSATSLRDSHTNAESNAAKHRRSMRFSLISRRSTRMSLVLRQSCADILGDISDDEEDSDSEGKFQPLPQRKSHYIPDVFKSQHDKRRSVIIESSSEFFTAIYGEGAAGKLVTKDEGKVNARRTSFVLDNVLAPITHDDLLEEIHRL